MAYKVPQPEDYPEVEGFQYKLARAHGKMHVEFVSILCQIETCIESFKTGDELSKEVSIEILEKTLSKFKKPEYYCKCPECNEPLTGEEAEQVADEGCPSCRRRFDVDDYKLD